MIDSLSPAYLINYDASEEVGQELAGSSPVPSQADVSASDKSACVTEVFKISYGYRVTGVPLVPRLVVDVVSNTATSQQVVQSVAPIAMVDEAYHDSLGHLESFLNKQLCGFLIFGFKVSGS